MPVTDEAHEARQEEARAIRAAAVEKLGKGPDPVLVEVRVTEFGDGMISTGRHVDGVGDVTHEAGDVLTVPESVANGLRRRGFAELVKRRAPAASKDGE